MPQLLGLGFFSRGKEKHQVSNDLGDFAYKSINCLHKKSAIKFCSTSKLKTSHILFAITKIHDLQVYSIICSYLLLQNFCLFIFIHVFCLIFAVKVSIYLKNHIILDCVEFGFRNEKWNFLLR